MNILYECPLCENMHTGEEWNIVTMNHLCKNREMRRKYIPFENPIHDHRRRKTEYKCPSCLEHIRRVLIKETKYDDSEIKK